MVFDQFDKMPGLRLLFTLAVVMIVIHGLRLTQPVALPFAVAGFLAVINLPLVFWLEKKGVPLAASIFLTVLAVAGVFGLIILLASQQFGVLQAQLPVYVSAVQAIADGWLVQIEARWPMLEGAREYVMGWVDLRTLAALAGGTFARTLSFFTATFLVLLILVFALGEAAVFPRKLRAIAGDRVASDERLAKIIGEVQGYLVMKSFVSLSTGVLLGLWTWAMGVDFPILLGLIALVLNYIPTIGSVIASAPALFLALIEFDLQHALVVAVGYLVVNIVFGNWLEPTLIGRRLGLSTLVVILSLVFWGWLWGPVGALLSVPLTMVVKIMLENTQDLKWVAVLLDKNAPVEPAASRGE